MSEKSTSADGTTQQADGNVEIQQASDSKAQTVKYETYDKVMSKLKKTEAEHKQVLEKLSQLEQEKMEAAGQKDQLIAALKKDLDLSRKKTTEIVKSFTTNVLHSQAKSKAVLAGCVDPAAFVQLMDFSGLDIDENFTVDDQALTEKIETMKKNKPYLFASKNLNVRDVSKPGFESGKVDFAKMSREELLNYTKGKKAII